MVHQNVALAAKHLTEPVTGAVARKPPSTMRHAPGLGMPAAATTRPSQSVESTHHSLEDCNSPSSRQAESNRLNDRQEKFCRYFIATLNASRAAREAGYSPQTARQQGHRLLQDNRIRHRLQVLQKGLGSDHGIDPVVLIGKLETVYRRAMEMHHFHAATRAIEVQARISGVLRQRAMPPDEDDIPVGQTGEPLPHGSDTPPVPPPGCGRRAKKRSTAVNDT